MSRKAFDVQAALRELEKWQEAGSDGGRRRFSRFGVRCEALLYSSGRGDVNTVIQPPMMIHIRDISRSGAGVLTNLPMRCGDRWELQPIAHGQSLATIPSFCRHQRTVIDGIYLTGVEFGIDASLLLALGVSAAAISQSESPRTAEAFSDCQFVDPGTLLDDEAA